ncbi:MAG TPA: NADH-quinone oxidoreductase subunit M [Gemmatales bacterium]|nr:NADH-quinone oxidoreductase subunit M [Gemmatales bacterium]HMP57814.1 NADH-quinone oxidoreductase subunit M [Gemmatales bacterium]
MGKMWLLLMLLAPLAGAAAALYLGDGRLRLVRLASLVATLAALLFAALIVTNYQTPTARTAGEPFGSDPDFAIRMPWLIYSQSEQTAPTTVYLELGVDGLSVWLIGLTALLMVPAVLISWETITDRPAAYYALLLSLETAMLGVFCAMDAVLFYVFFEFTLLPLFFLIGLWGGPRKRYAAKKFFIYTLAGSIISLVGLVGVILTLRDAGQPLTFSLTELAFRAGKTPIDAALQNWLFLALFIGLAVKVPLFPFHTWLPLAHVEAPTAGSVLLAGVLLKLGTYGFLRLALPLLPAACLQIGQPLVALLAVIGILYGSLCALAQDDIKKLVAYSSVAHLGFCMLGLFALNAEGMSGALLQMVNHGLSTGLLFLLVGMIYDRYHTRSMKELGGLAQRLPLLSFFMVVTCLASVGLPGLNGFVGEVLCLFGMYAVHPAYAVWGAVGIVLGAWYLMTLLQRVFFGPLREPAHGDEVVTDMNRRELAAVVPLVVFCVWIGVYPKPFLGAMKPEITALAERLAETARQLQAPSTSAGE